MKIKKEYIILLAVIIGLSFYLFTRQTNRALYELPQLPEMSGKEISKIEISGPEAKIVLKKVVESWLIGPEEYPASKNKVRQMIETIKGLTLTALISESKDYVRYDLTDEKKISVKAWIDDTLEREFDIGKTASSSQHTFVRLSGDTFVYQARDNFRNTFDQKVRDIRDKSVLSFAISDIREVRLAKEGQSLVFNRREVQSEDKDKKEDDPAGKTAPIPVSIWQAADGQKGDESKLNSLLGTLSQLECDSYITDRDKKAFTEPIYTIQVKGTKDYSLSIFAVREKETDTYPATSSENRYPFMLPEWKAKDLMPEFGELLVEDNKEDQS